MGLFAERSPLDIIKQYDLAPKKSFGQNFLINPSLTDKIASLISAIEDKVLVEIGSGPLTLTRSIIKKNPLKLNLVEKDERFIPLYQDLAKEYPKINISFLDVLELDFSSFGSNLTIISNLPYNISTPFLIKACFAAEHLDGMILMFQKEVADRIVSNKGTKKWGRLSVMAQAVFDIELALNVKAEAFTPPPKVQSAILKFTKKKDVPSNDELYRLEKLTKLIFGQRRKKLSSILKGRDFSRCEIDLNKRAEELSLQEILELGEAVS